MGSSGVALPVVTISLRHPDHAGTAGAGFGRREAAEIAGLQDRPRALPWRGGAAGGRPRRDGPAAGTANRRDALPRVPQTRLPLRHPGPRRLPLRLTERRGDREPVELSIRRNQTPSPILFSIASRILPFGIRWNVRFHVRIGIEIFLGLH